MNREEIDLFPHLASRQALLPDLKLAQQFGIYVATLRDLLNEGVGPRRAGALVQGQYYFLRCMAASAFKSWFLREATDNQVAKAKEIIWRHEKSYDLSQFDHETDRVFVARVFSRTKQWQVK